MKINHETRAALAVAILLSTGLSIRAQQAPSDPALEAAKAVVAAASASQIGPIIDSVENAMFSSIESAIRAQYPKVDQPTIDEIRMEVKSQTDAILNGSLPDLENAEAIEYSKDFSLQELTDLKTLIASPLYQKVIAVTPSIVNAAVVPWSQKIPALVAASSLEVDLDAILKKHGLKP
jgi:hypothetical protein